MNTIFLCITISFIISYVWEILDFPNEIASVFMSWMTKGAVKKVTLKKPLGCSLCMTFWCTLITLLICLPSLWWLAFVFAFFSKYFTYTLLIVRDICDTAYILLDTGISKIKNKFL